MDRKLMNEILSLATSVPTPIEGRAEGAHRSANLRDKLADLRAAAILTREAAALSASILDYVEHLETTLRTVRAERDRAEAENERLRAVLSQLVDAADEHHFLEWSCQRDSALPNALNAANELLGGDYV